MTNVQIKNNTLIFIAAIFSGFMLLSCSKKRDNNESLAVNICDYNNCFYLDVIGDSKLDTLVLERDTIYSAAINIILIKNGIKQNLLSIAPRMVDGRAVLTNPQVETITLSSNFTQSNQKELRVMIRNTDLIPDYIFIDLKFDNQWFVKRYYLCNSSPDEAVFIDMITVDKCLLDEFGKGGYVDQNYIIDLFRKNKLK